MLTQVTIDQITRRINALKSSQHLMLANLEVHGTADNYRLKGLGVEIHGAKAKRFQFQQVDAPTVCPPLSEGKGFFVIANRRYAIVLSEKYSDEIGPIPDILALSPLTLAILPDSNFWWHEVFRLPNGHEVEKIPVEARVPASWFQQFADQAAEFKLRPRWFMPNALANITFFRPARNPDGSFKIVPPGPEPF